MTAPSEVAVEPAGSLRGAVEVPGDKSVSHRALLLNALATGTATVWGLLDSGDVRATRAAVTALGASVTAREGATVVRASGVLTEPAGVIDCGNAGTSMRLLAGVLAAEPFFSVLTGDASLLRRPMGRVVQPLRRMGAWVDGRADGARAPLAIRGGALRPDTAHDLPVASAQLKSALLLAGRRVGVRVREPAPSRDHTERMLAAMGAEVARDDAGWLTLAPCARLEPVDVAVPGDVSSAAFWMVAACIVPGSDVVLRGVGLNPTRTGVIDALTAMGAEVEITPVDRPGAEPVGDVRVRAGGLRGARIDGELALRALDELPVLAVAAAFAEGETVIADAAELRVKESDRVARVAAGLRALGVGVEERPDGMVIDGRGPGGVRGPALVDAAGDHRLAMAFAVAGLAAPGGVSLRHAEEVASSYPSFFADLEALRG